MKIKKKLSNQNEKWQISWKNFRTYEKILDEISSKIKQFYFIIRKVYKKKVRESLLKLWVRFGMVKKSVKILSKFPKKFEENRSKYGVLPKVRLWYGLLISWSPSWWSVGVLPR